MSLWGLGFCNRYESSKCRYFKHNDFNMLKQHSYSKTTSKHGIKERNVFQLSFFTKGLYT